MTARRLALNLALMAGFVCAQSDNKPEIRGVVTDPNLNIGVAGAQITLFEFLLNAERTVVRTQIATTSTDTRGEFRLPLEHFGQYFIEVKKEGYSVPFFGGGGVSPNGAAASVDIDRDHPTPDLRFSLSLPGEITGKVVDEDGNPVAGLRVGIQKAPIPSDMESAAVTNQDGSFTTKKLSPGQYLVRLSPKAGDFETVTDTFSEGDLKIVDQDIDSTPSVPVPVSPGATANTGTLTIRKVPYYRAHVSVPSIDCQPKESWMVSVLPRNIRVALRYVSVPCGNEFLVRNLKPGSYWFAIRSDKPSRWALAAVDVTRQNVDVSMAISPTAEIHGRFVGAEGVTLPKFQRVGIMMRGRFDSAVGAVDPEGKFAVRNLWGLSHDLSVQGLGGRYYVKEIRYNGVVMADGMITPVPGAPAQDLEIVLDDQPATITGTVRDGDKPVSKPFVLVLKWPFTAGDPLLNSEHPAADDQGRFQISGLAPGEYRVIALTKNIVNTQISDQLLSRAEKVTLERGSLKDISLKRIDPSQ